MSHFSVDEAGMPHDEREGRDCRANVARRGGIVLRSWAPRVVEAPGVFFETATSTGKLILVQVEMIEVLDSDDEALAL
ncbi:hypothetical protein C8R45DRAFT_1089395 [Mycena sanguinolenta]|nr:hypothetical protein C8R45DRAFT_1089395 [Mycena sanguinolenta]